MKVLLIDNFDSFTYNLYDYIKQLDHKCTVLRNDAQALVEAGEYADSIVLSPGPGKPQDAGNLMKVVDKLCDKKPILGICLGHQALGIHFGMKLTKAKEPIHGIPSRLKIVDHPLFENVENGFSAMRYHSLILEEQENGEFETLARTDSGELMVMKHVNLPLVGMQFHPESILTSEGLKLLRNWFRLISKGLHLCATIFCITLVLH